MIKISSLLFIFILITVYQINSQSVLMKTAVEGTSFYQNKKEIKLKEVIQILDNNPNTLKLIKLAKSNYTTSRVFGIVGAGLVLVPVGISTFERLSKEINPNWKIGLAGASLILISIPIYREGNKNAKKAIDIYNSKFNPTSSNTTRFDYELVVNETGLGLRISF